MPGPSNLPAICIRPRSGTRRGELLGWLMTFVLTVGLIVLTTEHAFAQGTISALTYGSGSSGSITDGNLTFAISNCSKWSGSGTMTCSQVEAEAFGTRTGTEIEFLGNNGNSNGSNIITGASTQGDYFSITLTITAANGAAVSSFATALTANNSTFPYASNTLNSYTTSGGSSTGLTCTSTCDPTTYGSAITTTLSTGVTSLSFTYKVGVNSGNPGGVNLDNTALTFYGTGVPEPTSVSVIAVGIFGLGAVRWRFGLAGPAPSRGRKPCGPVRGASAFADWRISRRVGRAFV